MKVLLGIFLFLITGTVFAQVVTEATSNKTVYEYGEIMEVSLKVTNTSDEPFAYRGSSTGKHYVYSFSGFDTSPRYWLTDEVRDTLWKNQSIEITWQIEPKFTSFPTFTGEQTVKMHIWGASDSVKFQAQQYVGGDVFVYFDRDVVDTTEARNYADSLRIEVYEEYYGNKVYHPGYFWKVDSMLVDTLIHELLLDEKVLEAEIRGRYGIRSVDYVRTSIEEQDLERQDFSLSQNYPNPFNPETKIEFTLPRSGYIELTVFDLMGRKVRTLIERTMASGDHTVNFNSEELPSGTYIYRLKTSSGVITKKLTLIK